MAFWYKKDKESKKLNIGSIKKNNVPILILDKNWHYMFPSGKKTQKMLDLENKLNNLLKEQGRLTNEEKEYKNFKVECMNQIMVLMDDVYNNGNEKAKDDMSKSQKYIEEVNDKLVDIEERLNFVPNEIKQVNNQLLDESVQMSYSEMRSNKDRVKQLDMEIIELREKLKERIDEKIVKEEMIDRTYTFLHNLVGLDIINKLDRQNTE